MIEKIVNRKNLTYARRKVVANAGSAGTDGMQVEELFQHLKLNRDRIVTEIISCKYKPQPILGIEIPKSNGKTRMLGVPTVTDRLLQQAVLQVIEQKFECDFRESSFGFRPNRNALMAVQQSQGYIHEGYTHILDIDLKNFFDEVDHCLLLDLLYRKIKCPATLRLIRKWLKAPIQINGKLTRRRKGVPQGSPLSPLLSNILLHELDEFLEKKGHKYVRYADDFSIYAKTKAVARKIGNAVYLFLKDKLKLKINREMPEHGSAKGTHEVLAYVFLYTSTF